MGSPAMNFLTGVAKGGGIVSAGYEVKPDAELARRLLHYEGEEVYFGIRPENLGVRGATDIPEQDNVIHATVKLVEPIGAETIIIAESDSKETLVARVDAQLRAAVGDPIDFLAAPEKMQAFGSSEHNIRYDEAPVDLTPSLQNAVGL